MAESESPGLVQSIRRRLSLGRAEPAKEGRAASEVDSALENSLRGQISGQLGAESSEAVVLKTVYDPNKEAEFINKEMAAEGPAPVADVVRNFCDNGIATLCMKGLKPESPNQDGYAIVMQDKKFQLFAVLDGHGPHGHDICQFASDMMLKLFLRSEARNTDQEKAFTDAFVETQRLLECKTREGDMNADDSGTTCTVAYMPARAESPQLYVAHVGDSRGVLGRWDTSKRKVQAVDLTQDHKPNNPKERERIEKKGGRVVFDGYYNYRVYSKDGRGGLNMSRALGDIAAHRAGVTEVPEVAALPLEVVKVDLDSASDRFIILCTDGVWEFIESQTAVDIVAKHGRENVKEAVDELTRLSYEKWMEDSEGDMSDDITAVVVWL